ncbi:High mobility group superfamily [Penicillium bovifimosum]|uniref:High mobility group superfamily n=1 Tax=Penicillium bovifimosum TaxID=126998 RepID=A0A9W9GPG6_9EURO|nr:High mobility group superfamily [Penicillium bovifimosum]XP_056519111.1 High mobility group superfamily [Penicillium bovifimosum]KAJ5124711.1 High mobility group superfamily [Penicillium bovifimosum]KAJ5124712.1 High mobility group superfamily [Penicillium bovifimosum]
MFTSPLTNDPNDMPPSRCLEILWCEAMQNIEAAEGQILVPDNIVENVLGMDNLQEMHKRLANMNNGVAYMHFDESLDAWRLSTTDEYLNERTPAQELRDAEIPISFKDHKLVSQSIYRSADLGTLPSLPVPGAAAAAHVPRPPNCFILYRQANHHIVKESNPGVSNNEISRILGNRWKNERPEVRERYTRLADQLKREHAVKHPNYQYAPRRPSERKRRGPRANAETIRYVDQEPAFQHALESSERIGKDWYIEIDDKLVGMLNDKGLLWGPNGVAPEPDSYSQTELISMANDLTSGDNLVTLDGTLNLNIDNQGMPLPTMF